MAADEYDASGGSDGGAAGGGAADQPQAPGTQVNGAPVTREFVIAQYMRWLGRPPESEDVIQGWMHNPGGALAVSQAISSGPEARAFAAQGGRGPNPNPQPGDPPAALGDLRTRIAAALRAADSTDDPNYWYAKISADPNGAGSAWGYWLDRINKGDGAAAVRNGTVKPFNDSNTGTLGTMTQGGLLDPFTEQFHPPDTSWQPPELPKFDFQYKDFSAPDPTTIANDPSYQFRKQQGEQSLTNNAAASGLARSGGTLKDFINYGQNFASTEYNNIYNRDLGTWGANEKKAFDTATTDFGAKLTGYTTTAAARQRQSETDWQHAWDQYMGKFDIYKSNHAFPADVLLRAAGLGASGGNPSSSGV